MKIQILPHADRQFKKLPRQLQATLINKIESLAYSPFPSGIKKLANKDAFRLRVGNYRVIYQVNKKTQVITILFIAHRKDIYRLFS